MCKPHATVGHSGRSLLLSIFYFCLVQDSFKRVKDEDDVDTMAEISDKCRALANHLKRADNSRKLLHQECAVSSHYPKAIPVGNDTR